MAATAQDVRIAHGASLVATRIWVFRRDDDGDSPAFPATAALWSAGPAEDPVLLLVTNLHCVSGWDHVNDRLADPRSGLIPTHLRIELRFASVADNRLGAGELLKPLRNPLGEAIWWVDPQHGTAVDVAVVPLGPRSKVLEALQVPDHQRLATLPVNSFQEPFPFEVQAGDDALVLGYPQGFDGGGGFPLWKRASIASEPGFDLDGLPKLLIDAYTRKGMSGSPVLVRRVGMFELPDGHRAMGRSTKFIGIYSGRLGDDLLGASLGIVWKADRVREIVAAQRRGVGYWDRTP